MRWSIGIISFIGMHLKKNYRIGHKYDFSYHNRLLKGQIVFILELTPFQTVHKTKLTSANVEILKIKKLSSHLRLVPFQTVYEPKLTSGKDLSLS